MFNYVKKWWNVPATHPIALAIGGFTVAALGTYALIYVIQNKNSRYPYS